MLLALRSLFEVQPGSDVTVYLTGVSANAAIGIGHVTGTEIPTAAGGSILPISLQDIKRFLRERYAKDYERTIKLNRGVSANAAIGNGRVDVRIQIISATAASAIGAGAIGVSFQLISVNSRPIVLNAGIIYIAPSIRVYGRSAPMVAAVSSVCRLQIDLDLTPDELAALSETPLF